MQLSEAIQMLQDQAVIYGPETELITRDELGATRPQVQARAVQIRNGASLTNAIILEAERPAGPIGCEGCGWTRSHSTWCRFNPTIIKEKENAAKNPADETAAQAPANGHG